MKNTIGTLPKSPPPKKEKQMWKETKSIPFEHKCMTFLALNKHLN